MKSTQALKESGYSPRSGVVVRDNLTLFVWCEDQAIEVVLSPEQALDLGLSLFEVVRGALTTAKQQREAVKCQN